MVFLLTGGRAPDGRRGGRGGHRRRWRGRGGGDGGGGGGGRGSRRAPPAAPDPRPGAPLRARGPDLRVEPGAEVRVAPATRSPGGARRGHETDVLAPDLKKIYNFKNKLLFLGEITCPVLTFVNPTAFCASPGLRSPVAWWSAAAAWRVNSFYRKGAKLISLELSGEKVVSCLVSGLLLPLHGDHSLLLLLLLLLLQLSLLLQDSPLHLSVLRKE